MSKACEARQYSDQMQCGRCGLAWDMNDFAPPPCKPTIDRRAIPSRAATTQARRVEDSIAGALGIARSQWEIEPPARRNGCHSKPRPVAGAVTHLAQDGYFPPMPDAPAPGRARAQVARFVEIKHVMSTDCRYDKRESDPACKGCPWVSTP